MKMINLIPLTLLSLTLMLAGCSKNSNNLKIDEPVVPIVLSNQLAQVDKTNTVSRIRIISGNGGYRIVLPKQLLIVPTNSIELQNVDFSDDILSLRIEDGNNIVIERKLLTDQWVSGFFMVADRKGSKGIFVVDQTNICGNLYDFKELERYYLNSSNYWQE